MCNPLKNVNVPPEKFSTNPPPPPTPQFMYFNHHCNISITRTESQFLPKDLNPSKNNLNLTLTEIYLNHIFPPLWGRGEPPAHPCI